jgi:hypothetical protein
MKKKKSLVTRVELKNYLKKLLDEDDGLRPCDTPKLVDDHFGRRAIGMEDLVLDLCQEIIEEAPESGDDNAYSSYSDLHID